MFIDTHAHLDFKEFDSDRDEVIKRAFEGGIQKIINVGCNLERSRAAIELARSCGVGVYASIGIHPHDVANYELETTERELRKLAHNDKVVAIGECGLDYYRLDQKLKSHLFCDRRKDVISGVNGVKKINKSKEISKKQNSQLFDDRSKVENGKIISKDIKDKKTVQKEFFEMQIKLAQELNLPLIIHCRDAFDDLLKILISNLQFPISNIGVAHCFSGNRKFAQEFLKLGFLISFTGSITYAKSDAEILKVVKEVPLEKIMVETDSPYLAPVPKRGARNEPLYVKYIVQKIADIKNISLTEVEKTTTKNVIKLFNL